MERKEASPRILTTTPVSLCLHLFLQEWEVFALCLTSRQTRRLYAPFMHCFGEQTFDMTEDKDLGRLCECISNQSLKHRIAIVDDGVLPSKLDFSVLAHVSDLKWEGTWRVAASHLDFPRKLRTLTVVLTHQKAKNSAPEPRALPPNLTHLSTNSLAYFDMQSSSLKELTLTYGLTKLELDPSHCPNLTHLELLYSNELLCEHIESGPFLAEFTQLQSLCLNVCVEALCDLLRGNLPPNLWKLELNRRSPSFNGMAFSLKTAEMLPASIRDLKVGSLNSRPFTYTLPPKLETLWCRSFAKADFHCGCFPLTLTSCTFQCCEFLCVEDTNVLPVGLTHLEFNGVFKTQLVADYYVSLTSLVYLNARKRSEQVLFTPPNVQKLTVDARMLQHPEIEYAFDSVVDLKVTDLSTEFPTAALLVLFPKLNSLDAPNLISCTKMSVPHLLITTLCVVGAPNWIFRLTPNLKKLIITDLDEGSVFARRLPKSIISMQIRIFDCQEMNTQRLMHFLEKVVLSLPNIQTLELNGLFATKYARYVYKLILAKEIECYVVVNNSNFSHSIHFLR